MSTICCIPRNRTLACLHMATDVQISDVSITNSQKSRIFEGRGGVYDVTLRKLYNILCSDAQTAPRFSAARPFKEPLPRIIMKATTLTAFILFALCASLAECLIRPRELTRHISTTLRKRSDNCDDERLKELIRTVPRECVSALFDGIDDFEHFNNLICSEKCGLLFYEFIVDCYEEDITGKVWDLLCASNSKGVLCYDTIDGLLQDALSELLDACENATSEYCSTECIFDLEQSNIVTGCCLYSYEAIESGLDETQDMWTACGVEIPGLCIGGLTHEEVDAPGRGAQVQDGATTAAGSIAVLVAAVLAALS